MLYLRRFCRVVLWYLLSLISIFIYVNSNQTFHTTARDHPVPDPCSSGTGVSPGHRYWGGLSLCSHPHPREVIVTNYNLSWSRNPPQSSCDKQPVPLWGEAKRPTSWAAEMGAAEPVRCAVRGGVGEPHGAGRSNRAMGNKGSYLSFNSNISKFVADFFCLLDPLSFLCTVWCEQGKEGRQAALYKCFSPKCP